MTHGSGDYVIAFSTAPQLRATAASAPRNREVLSDDGLSPLFQAVREATEEAIINSLLRATTVTGHQGHTVEAIPIDRVTKYGGGEHGTANQRNEHVCCAPL